jgi:aminopeptidase-like protein
MDMQSKIESQVMASVGVIHTARRLTSATALKLYALIASVYALGVLVWVSKIEENLLHVANGGVLAVGNFVLYAAVHTSIAVQLALFVAATALISLAADMLRSISAGQATA